VTLEDWRDLERTVEEQVAQIRAKAQETYLACTAKAGELAERFATYLLVRGDEVEAEEPAYRGQGWCS